MFHFTLEMIGRADLLVKHTVKGSHRHFEELDLKVFEPSHARYHPKIWDIRCFHAKPQSDVYQEYPSERHRPCGSSFRRLRDAIVTGATTGPVQLVTSCEGGFTTNAPGLVLWLESLDSAHLKNLNLFVVKRDSEDPLQFSASGYVKAYELLQEGSQDAEVKEYEDEL